MLSALKNFKLGIKLNLILVGILISSTTISGILLSQVLEKKVEREVADKAFLMIETMNSVRNYTSSKVKPKLVNTLATSSKFIPETVPAYSAREVFEDLRKQTEYQDLSYKEATLNPTNLRDKADSFEAKITKKFRQNRQLKEQTGFRTNGQEEFYYVARPLEIKKASCLECHSTPAKAPINLINTYGKDNGFGWKLNEIVASQIISIPANKVYKAAKQLKLLILGIVVTALVVSIALVNWFLNQSIIQPVKEIAIKANKISTGDLDRQFQHDSKDEIGTLAKSLNRMVRSLKIAFEMIDNNN